MEVGLSTFFWRKRRFIDRLSDCLQHGIRIVEVWGEKDHFPYRNHHELPDIATQLAELGITAHSIHAPFTIDASSDRVDISSLDDAQRRRSVHEICDAAESFLELKAGKMLVVHPGDHLFSDNPKERLTQSKTSLEQLGKFAANYGLTIAVENLVPGDVCGSPRDTVELVKDIDMPQLGICLDLGHAFCAVRRLKSSIKLCGPKLLTIHVSDNDGTNDDHFPPFQGLINWDEVFCGLREVGYKGPSILEVRGRFGFEAIANIMPRLRAV